MQFQIQDYLTYCFQKSFDGYSVESYKDDKKQYHRSNGPALIHYYPDGTIAEQFWFEHGKSHNLNGPAYIVYEKDGKVHARSWYINGEFVTQKYARKSKIESKKSEKTKLLEKISEIENNLKELRNNVQQTS